MRIKVAARDARVNSRYNWSPGIRATMYGVAAALAPIHPRAAVV
jgi:hypothetical protein